MAKKEKKHVCPEGIAPWVLTYGDMMSLLLVFFILLFSFATVDASKFSQIVVSLRGALGVLSGGKQLLKDGTTPSSRTAKGDSFYVEMGGLQREIMDILKSVASKGQVKTRFESRGLVVSIAGDVLFDPDSVVVKPKAKEIMLKLLELIKAFPNRIAVEGHTAETPTMRYRSHWELSVLRATAVGTYLTEQAPEISSRIHMSGYGSQRPLASNDTEIGKARNRRVDVIFFRYRKKEEAK